MRLCCVMFGGGGGGGGFNRLGEVDRYVGVYGTV